MGNPPKKWLSLLGPGILVAATGVGAGDLATAAFTGSRLGLATLPILGLVLIEFTQLVKWYSVTGALFIPMLALALLILNGQSTWVTKPYRNSPLTTLLLVGTLLFFLFAGWLVLRSRF